MRGRRVPPEYLQRVIAERQGLDLSTLPDGDEDVDKTERDEAEKELEEEAQRRYRPRTLGTNADRYREIEEGVLEQEDEEELASTYVFLSLIVLILILNCTYRLRLTSMHIRGDCEGIGEDAAEGRVGIANADANATPWRTICTKIKQQKRSTSGWRRQ